MGNTLTKRVGLERPLVWTVVLLLQTAAFAQSPQQMVPWLDLPSSWALSVKDGIVTAVPGDLESGTVLALMVEPESQSKLTLEADYDKALHDIGGPWTPIGEPSNQKVDGGWTFRVGVGTVMLDGERYIGQTAVARCGSRRVRSWILASSDVVFNRYKSVTANAVASAQDITLRAQPGAAATAAPPAPTPVEGGPIYVGHVPPGFGQGVSGVYLGLERGIHAHAGYALGSPSTSIDDEYEIDVFFPDGTYRRRLPKRGLASDLQWDRGQIPVLWGTWSRSGNTITVKRGGYTTSYRVKDSNTLVSDRDRDWNKLQMKPNTRFNGIYEPSNWRDADAPQLVLRPDGTYEDHNGFLYRYAGADCLLVPDGREMLHRWSDAQAMREMGDGRGTYTYADFSLILRDQNGRVWQVALGVPPDQKMPSPKWMLLNERQMMRK